jgi:hypothetical protein
MEKREFSEMLAYKIQTSGNYPEERIQHSEHSKSLKSRARRCWNTCFIDIYKVCHVESTGIIFTLPEK